MMVINGTVVTHWSRTQATCAFSVAESEYYATVTGTAEGLGMQLLMSDQGLKAEVRTWTESRAANSVASRRTFGREGLA